jgi:hypothetical protein
MDAIIIKARFIISKILKCRAQKYKKNIKYHDLPKKIVIPIFSKNYNRDTLLGKI